MKKYTKIGLGIFAVVFGMIALSSCTASFCTVNDQSHMLYAIDNGVTKYTDDASVENALPLDGFTNIYYTTEIKEGSMIDTINKSALGSEFKVPSINYWHLLDVEVLKYALGNRDYSTVTKDDITNALEENGYKKYADDTIGIKESKQKVWTNWDLFDKKVRNDTAISIDECATKDYVALYKRTMNQEVSRYRSCIAINDGYYGYYGINGEKTSVFIEGKSWGYAWSKGFFEGLLVYPIAWLVDTFCSLLLNGGVAGGVAQLLAILFVTVIVRSLMLLATIKQTSGNAKMQELTPELTKIQEKYPNANTNQYEKQRLAEETQKLYKKHGVNPFTSIIVMIIQFPVFICVWGALQGSAYLSTDSFLGLHLSDSLSSVLFNWSNWANPASGVWTALVLFLLMAGAQVVSMLLPQFIQKRKAKKVSKLGVNPAANKQQSTMKMFTYGMMIMIIIMGFSLASAMGVYWFVGALFSIAQTLIIQAVQNRKSNRKQRR